MLSEFPNYTPDLVFDFFQYLLDRSYECYWYYRKKHLGLAHGQVISLSITDVHSRKFIRDVMLDYEWFGAADVRVEDAGWIVCLPTPTYINKLEIIWKERLELLRNLLFTDVFRDRIHDGTNEQDREEYIQHIRADTSAQPRNIFDGSKYKDKIIDTRAIFEGAMNRIFQ